MVYNLYKCMCYSCFIYLCPLYLRKSRAPLPISFETVTAETFYRVDSSHERTSYSTLYSDIVYQTMVFSIPIDFMNIIVWYMLLFFLLTRYFLFFYMRIKNSFSYCIEIVYFSYLYIIYYSNNFPLQLSSERILVIG